LKENIRHFGDKRKKQKGQCQSILKGFSKINKIKSPYFQGKRRRGGRRRRKS
jgi:hypothetical protein